MNTFDFQTRTETAEFNSNPQHGVRYGFYSNLPGPNQTAWLECLCGEELTGQTSSWEDAGREFDLHLAGVQEP